MNLHRASRRRRNTGWSHLMVACLLGAHPLSCLAQDLALSDTQLDRLGIRVAAASVAKTLEVSNLSAEVQVPIAGNAAVVAPYAGRVLRVEVDEGDSVHRGQILASVSSREYATDHALLHRRRTEADVARRQAARDDALLEAGVIPKSRAETSRSLATALQAELESMESAVGAFHDDGTDATSFNLRAPVAGFVVSRHLQTSASIAAQEVAFVIARDARWRLEVDVPVAVATHLTPEARLAVGTLEIAVEGRGTTLDPATQTIKVRGTLPADSGFLPGQRVIARLRLPPPADSVQLPRGALTHTGRRGEVFVATPTQSGKAFRQVDVEVLSEAEDGAVVTGALTAGEEVVVSGTSALKGMGGG